MHTIEKKEITPVIIPVTQFWSRECRKLHLRESNFTNFPGGGMPPDPPRSSCLWHSTAWTVHVHRLNHCIWYFQVLPKTLPNYTVEKSNLLLMLSGDLDCPWGRLKNPHTIQGEELGKRPRSLSCLIFSTLVAADGSNTCRLTLNFLYNQNLIIHDCIGLCSS